MSDPTTDALVERVREAVTLIEDWLPPMGMTSIPEEPIKPAQANALWAAKREISKSLTTLAARVEELERERDDFQRAGQDYMADKLRAEAEVQRLEEGIASAMTSLATGPLRDGYAYAVLAALSEEPRT